MPAQDALHVAWRVLHDAQTGRMPLDASVGSYMDARVAECGGASAAVIGFVAAAGQLVYELSALTGEEPALLVQRRSDFHSTEVMQMDLDKDTDE